MKTDKPTPEQLETFLKGLSDNDLLELIVTRAHHDNRSPVEFISKANGSSCGIDNEGYRLALKEKADRANAFFKDLEESINTLRLINKDSIDPIIELNRLAAGAVERPFSKRDYPVATILEDVNPLSLLKDQFQMQLTSPYGATRPSPWFEEQRDGRRTPATDRFEKFIKDLPIHELLEVGDLIVNNPVVRGLGDYHSLALNQSETIYHTDLPLIYGEIKSRVKQMGVVK